MPNVRGSRGRGRGRPSRQDVLSREVAEAEQNYISFVKSASFHEHTLIMSQSDLQSIWSEIENQFKATVVDKTIATALVRRYAEVERAVSLAREIFDAAEKSRLVAYQTMEQKRSELTSHLIRSAQS